MVHWPVPFLAAPTVEAQAIACVNSLQGRPYRATISDSEGASLPARGTAVEDEAEAGMVLALAKHLGAAADAGGSNAALSMAPSAASLASIASSAAWLTSGAGSG